MTSRAVTLAKIQSLESVEEVEGFRYGLEYQGYLLQPDLEDALRARYVVLLREAIARATKKR